MNLEKHKQNTINQTKALLEILSPDERIDLMNNIMADYCLHCGHKQPSNQTCQCNNDE